MYWLYIYSSQVLLQLDFAMAYRWPTDASTHLHPIVVWHSRYYPAGAALRLLGRTTSNSLTDTLKNCSSTG